MRAAADGSRSAGASYIETSDAPGDFSTSYSIDVGDSFSGELGSERSAPPGHDSGDFIEVSLVRGETYAFLLTWDEGDKNPYFRVRTNNWDWSQTAPVNAADSSALLIHTADKNGYAFHLEVRTAPANSQPVQDPYVGSYSITTRLVEKDETTDAPGLTTPYSMGVGETFTGALHFMADRDWVQIELAAGTSYTFDMRAYGGFLSEFELRDGNGTLVESQEAAEPNADLQIAFTPTVSGNFYLAAGASDNNTRQDGYYEVTTQSNGPTYDEVTDAASDSSTSYTISVGDPFTGILSETTDEDWIRIDLTAGETYTFAVEGTAELADTWLRLRDSNSMLVAWDDDGGPGNFSLLNFAATESGTYYLSIESEEADYEGLYTLTTSTRDPLPPAVFTDVETEDAPDNTSTTYNLLPGDTFSGDLSSLNDTEADWLKIQLGADQVYSFTLDWDDPETPQLFLYGSGGQFLNFGVDQSTESKIELVLPSVAPGDYYLGITSGANGTFSGSYDLTTSVVAVDEDVDATTSTVTTSEMSVGETFTGVFESSGDRDWIKVYLEAGTAYSFELESFGTRGSSLRLRDDQGAVVSVNEFEGDSFVNAQITTNVATSGYYYLDAGAKAGTSSGYYELTAKANVYTYDQIADYLVSGYWGEQYAFNVTPGGFLTVDITGLTAAGQYLATTALEAWTIVSGINFSFVSNNAHIKFDDNESGAHAEFFYTGSTINYADINVSTNWLATYGTSLDSYSFQTYIHEIGHALGLGHPGPYDIVATYGVDNIYANDSWQASIMSYFDQIDNTFIDASFAFLLTPMVADILAIQQLYGTATDIHLGDTTYGFNSTAGGYLDSFVNSFNPIAGTIVDNSGIDTLDFSGFVSDQTLDLREETPSDIGGLTGNFIIARGTVIENAIGGSGDDTLTGNAAANVLTGGAGADTLTGGAAGDTFAFADGDSGAPVADRDLITDFVSGTDLLDLSAMDADTQTGGNQEFRFLGTDAFDGAAGALRYAYDAGRDVTTLEGDTDGDGTADFAIDLTGNIAIGLGDLAPDSARSGLPVSLTGDGLANTLEGGFAGDTLSGLGGNDTLRGFAGDDLLDGGTGADTMEGGEGDDTYVVDNVGDVVTEEGGASFTAPSGWTQLGIHDFNGDGNLDVLMSSGTKVQFWLLDETWSVSSTVDAPYDATWPVVGLIDANGDGQMDVLYNKAGTSSYYAHYFNGTTRIGGGFTTNTAVLSSALPPGNAGTDLVQSSISYTLTSGVENLTLTGASAIDGTGNDLDNILIGNSGSNVLSGKAGADTLTGGGSADTFAFADGDSGTAIDDRDLITDFVSGTDLLDLSAMDAETGTSGNQAFRFLGTGAFDGDAGALRYSYDAGRGVTTLEGDTDGDGVADFAIDLSGNITLADADFTSGSLLTPLTLTGDVFANTLEGERLNDTLSGLGGNDTLRGFAGNDLLDGGTGADTMEGGEGDDTYVVDNVGDVVTEKGSVSFTVPAGWELKGVHDVNGDGNLDVLMSSGTQVQFWLLDESWAVSSTINLPYNAAWPVIGLQDANGDGQMDVLYQQSGTSNYYAHYFNGTTRIGGGYTNNTAVLSADLPSGNAGTDLVQASISYTLTSGVENLTLTGSSAIDGTGNELDNILIGNSAANVLSGKVGADTMTGGGSADTFAFADGDSGTAIEDRDLITDFVSGTDLLDLTAMDAEEGTSGNQAFRFLGTAALDGSTGALRYAYDAGRNVTTLEGDTDGDGAADFAIDFNGNITLSETDFVAKSLLLPLTLTGDGSANTLEGDQLNDTLSGLGGNDTLRGFAGDDLLDGGTGADTMEGGEGDDTYVVDDAGDVVTEEGGASFTAPSGWTQLGIHDFNGDGNLDVLMSSGTKVQFWLLDESWSVSSTVDAPFDAAWPVVGLIDANGDGQMDVLYNKAGTSSYYAHYFNGTTRIGGGFTTNTAVLSSALPSGNAGTDLVQASVSYTLTSGVENLTLTGSSAIDGTGNELDNILIGNSGANVLSGAAGADTMTGNGAADTFAFADGDSGTAIDDRDLITDFVSGTDLLDLSAMDAEDGTSGNQAFRFLGTAALDGDVGALRYGYDAVRSVTTLEGDTDGDGTADFAIDLSGNITLSATDLVAGSLLAPMTLTGDGSANTLEGERLNDTLSGLGGNDTLRGFAGNDLLDGGTGADTMEGGEGDDTYVVDNVGDVVTEEGAISFTVPAGWELKGVHDVNGDGNLDVLMSSGTQVQFWLLDDSWAVSSTVNLPYNAAWPVIGLQDANGDGQMDVLYQQSGTSTYYAHYFNGTTRIGGGYTTNTAVLSADLPSGNAGTDLVQASITYTLTSGVENLTLTGSGNIDGTGNDLDNILIGNSGSNVLSGKAGADTLTGGGSADTFAFADGDSGTAIADRDLITDFVSGTDLLDLSAMDANTTILGSQAFRFLGTAALDGSTGTLRYAYDAGRNVTTLEGDIDGDGTADFAIDLSGNITLSESDFAAGSLVEPVNLTGDGSANTLEGGLVDDTLSGLGGNDTLRGFAGNDLLDGGTGADTMEGGEGDDTYVVDNAGDVVVEGGAGAFTYPAGWDVKGFHDFNGDGHIDILAVSQTQAVFWLQNNWQRYSAIDIPFNAAWPVVGLVDANNDGQMDVLYQQSGTSTYYAHFFDGTTRIGGGYTPALNVLSADLPVVDAGTDLVQASVSYALTAGVENLMLTGTDDIDGTGNGLDNILTGNSGANFLTGGDGSDTFVFATSNGGHDTVADFAAGALSEDVIEFGSSVFADFASVLAAAADDGTDTTITIDADTSVLLQGILVADLHSDDFQFV